MASGKRAGYHPSHVQHQSKEATLKEQGFYHTSAWRRLRVKALERDHYLCKNCLRNHRITTATEVHHILPVDDHPELALVLDNLESLCWDCHEQTKDHGKRVMQAPAGVRVIKVSNGSDDEAIGE